MDLEQQALYYQQGDDNNKQEEKVGFSAESVRMGFIRKVYGILSVQLLITVGVCALAVKYAAFQKFLQANLLAIFIPCLCLTLITSIVLMCFKSIARQVPTNYFLLLIFTICEALLVGIICSLSNPQIVLMAAVLTAGLVVALTLYALFTKTDFTMYGGLLFILLVVLMIMGFFMFFTNNKILNVIYCGIGVIIFGVYLIYDTQLIVGGKKYELSMDDYVVAALMLYIDIIQLFLYILEILNTLFGQN